MRKNIRISLTLVLACLMLFSIAIVASAETTPTASGQCGESLNWAYYEDTQTLTITGTGAMTSQSSASKYEWNTYKTAVETVIIGDGVTSITGNAFSGFTALKTVDISDTVETIATYAFNGCSALETVSIGSGVKTVGTYAFRNCNAITTVNISSLENWVTISFANTASNPAGISKSLYLNGTLLETYTLPESVTTIASHAFYNNRSLTKLVIPNSVTTIASNAFTYCTNLTFYCYDGSYAESFLATNKLTYKILRDDATASGSAGTYANWYFYEDTKTLVIEGSGALNSYSYSKLTKIPWYSHRSNIEHLEISEGITIIGSCSFWGLTKVKSIELPDSITYIGSRAFQNCKIMESITIGPNVATITSNAFTQCAALKKVYISDINSWVNISFSNYNSNPIYFGKNLYLNGLLLKNYIMPDDVTSIKMYAFANLKSLESITFSPSLKTIGAYAFSYCTNLKDINFSTGVTSISNHAFSKCSSLTRVNVPSIDVWTNIAFSNYAANPIHRSHKLYENGVLVRDLIIPEGVTDIKTNAFYSLTSSTSITLPSTIQTCPTSAFIVNTKASVVYGTPGTVAESFAASKKSSYAKFVNIEEKPVVELKAINVSDATFNMVVGEGATLSAAITPDNANGSKIVWSSTDDGVVAVSGGVLKAVSAGQATVTAKSSDGTLESSCVVTVSDSVVPVVGVSLDLGNVTIKNGATITLQATVNPSNATNTALAWDSSNKDVATVADGVVTAVGAGTTIITVTTVDGGYTATCNVTVSDMKVPVTGIELSQTTATMNVDDKLTLVATVLPADATNKGLVWATSADSVATVDNGVVTAVGEGVADITVTTVDGEFTATCTVTVEDTGVSLDGISLNKTSASIAVGDTLSLSVVYDPEDATNKNVSWTSSDNTKATVVDGVVTALSDGVVTITATSEDGEHKATCTVIITTTNETPVTPW